MSWGQFRASLPAVEGDGQSALSRSSSSSSRLFLFRSIANSCLAEFGMPWYRGRGLEPIV